MPGYIIHLTEAKLIADRLEDTMPDMGLKSTWREEFYYGALLPDAAEKLKKADSHFWDKSDVQYVTMIPNLDVFCRKYEARNLSFVYWGYLAHLQLDSLFWKKFMKENIEFIDQTGKCSDQLKQVTNVKLKKTGRIIGLKEFFSDEYLYGDYTKLNEAFIQNYDLTIPTYRDDIKKEINEANYEGMKVVLDKLKHFISKKKLASGQAKVICFEEMNMFLKETAEQFVACYREKMGALPH